MKNLIQTEIGEFNADIFRSEENIILYGGESFPSCYKVTLKKDGTFYSRLQSKEIDAQSVAMLIINPWSGWYWYVSDDCDKKKLFRPNETYKKLKKKFKILIELKRLRSLVKNYQDAPNQSWGKEELEEINNAQKEIERLMKKIESLNI